MLNFYGNEASGLML